jgi:putative SOS response-associated peptidase YedK
MIFEPNFETGKAVRWGISRVDGKPMGIAGLWSAWRTPEGEIWDSFTMLTINAQSHGLMNRFHRPEDEKRMVVILPEASFDTWLEGTEKEARELIVPFAAQGMQAEPRPLVRARSVPAASKSPNAGDLLA